MQRMNIFNIHECKVIRIKISILGYWNSIPSIDILKIIKNDIRSSLKTSTTIISWSWILPVFYIMEKYILKDSRFHLIYNI